MLSGLQSSVLVGVFEFKTVGGSKSDWVLHIHRGKGSKQAHFFSPLPMSVWGVRWTGPLHGVLLCVFRACC